VIGNITIKHQCTTKYLISGNAKEGTAIYSEPKTTTIEVLFERQTLQSHLQRELSQLAIGRQASYRKAKDVPTIERITVGTVSAQTITESPENMLKRWKRENAETPFTDEQLSECETKLGGIFSAEMIKSALNA